MELQIKMPVPRLCVVRQDGRALLHGLFVKAWTHGASASIGGFAAGQETMPMALVELEDGCALAYAYLFETSPDGFCAWGEERNGN